MKTISGTSLAMQGDVRGPFGVRTSARIAIKRNRVKQLGARRANTAVVGLASGAHGAAAVRVCVGHEEEKKKLLFRSAHCGLAAAPFVAVSPSTFQPSHHRVLGKSTNKDRRRDSEFDPTIPTTTQAPAKTTDEPSHQNTAQAHTKPKKGSAESGKVRTPHSGFQDFQSLHFNQEYHRNHCTKAKRAN